MVEAILTEIMEEDDKINERHISSVLGSMMHTKQT